MGPGVTLGTKTSPMALWSMILGLVSLLLVFLCLGYVTGILAIVFGCIGLSAVSSGQGRVKGKGMAWTGILSAISAFALHGLFIAYMASKEADLPERERNAKSALSAAQTKVMTDSNGTAHGNTRRAKELAKEFSSTMKTMHSAFFEREGDAPTVSMSGGEFVTFCQLSDQGCAFIVHVPEYRKHTDDAKESLSELAWTVASSVAENHPTELPPESALAVGLRGAILYGSIMTGRAGAESPESDNGDEDVLVRYFTAREDPESTEKLVEGDDTE